MNRGALSKNIINDQKMARWFEGSAFFRFLKEGSPLSIINGLDSIDGFITSMVNLNYIQESINTFFINFYFI